MKSRLDRIVTGCNFVKSLIMDNKHGSEIYKRSAARLILLLQDELAGKPEDVVVEDLETKDIQSIFTP